MADVLVAGSYNAAFTIYGDRLPRLGETVLGDGFDWGPGGKGANQAIGLRRLGADVCFATKIGRDIFGEHARQVLTREGLPERAILTGSGHTGVAFILVGQHGENAISVAPGANLELGLADAAALDGELGGCRFVLAQLECRTELAVDLARWARQRDMRCVLNPAPARPLPAQALPLFDVLTPNETELAVLAGCLAIPGSTVEEQALGLVRHGVPDLVVTLGENGALWASAHGVRHFQAYPAEVVDTTGAGDAFTAALVAALSAGEAMETAIDQGCRAGAYCVAHPGVIDGLAGRDELDEVVPRRGTPPARSRPT